MTIGDPDFPIHGLNISTVAPNVTYNPNITNTITTTSGNGISFHSDPTDTIHIGGSTTITGTTITGTKITVNGQEQGNITFNTGGDAGWVMDPKQSLENALRLALSQKDMSEEELKEMAGRMIEEILAEEIVDV